MVISFYFETPIKLKKRLLLKKFIRKINLKEGNKIGSLAFIFCSDNYLLNINQRFLDHNYYTDIITFNLGSGIKTELAVGEIYISIDRVEENANKFNIKVEEELNRVIFHGVLHLLGYNDKTVAQKKKMKEKENYYLNKYKNFVPRET